MKAIDFFFFLMLEDTLIFLFDCVFHRCRKRKSSFKLMRRQHRRFHKERIQKQLHLAGRSSQGHAVKSCRVRGVTRTCWANLPPSCSAAGRRTLVSRAEGFWSFCIGIRFLHLQRPWKRMSNSSICVHVCARVCVLGLTYFCCTDMRLAFQPHKSNCRHRHTAAWGACWCQYSHLKTLNMCNPF